MSSRIEYRGEAASLLSRGAATECSPGRKPGEDVVFEVKPRRGERCYGICRTYEPLFHYRLHRGMYPPVSRVHSRHQCHGSPKTDRNLGPARCRPELE